MNLRSGKSVKIDFTKMPKKAVSEPFVFPKSTEQKLAEALAEIETLKVEKNRLTNRCMNIEYYQTTIDSCKKELAAALDRSKELEVENEALKKKNEDLESLVKYLEGEIDSWKEQYGRALDRSNQLHDRIKNPFRGAISSPF